MKTVWYYRKAWHVDQWNRIQSPKIKSLVNWFCHRCQDNSMGERIVFTTNGTRKTGYPQAKKKKVDPHLTPYKNLLKKNQRLKCKS